MRTKDPVPKSRPLPRGALRRFAREEDGSMVVFSLFVAMITFVTLGLAVDAMHAEYERTKLQSTCDRSILAAADLDQPYVPAEVVRSYFDAAGLSDALGADAEVEQTLNSRTVRVRAEDRMPTSFLHMVGLDAIDFAADCAANETIPDVEVSLVLDVSTSMSSYGRLSNMQDAARDFVNAVLPPEGAAASEDGGTVSISLVPYSMSVNVTPEVRDWYNVDQIHDYSSCVMFDDADYDTTAIDPDQELRQYPHFDHVDGDYTGKDPWVVERPLCQRTSSDDDGDSPMLPFQTTHAPLLDAIDDFEVVGATGIAAGMKWGLALLDPAARGLADHLRAAGRAAPETAGRPYDFDREETTKIAILMTDGDPDGERDLHPAVRSGPSNVWHDTLNDRYSVLLRGRYLRQYPYDRMDEDDAWASRDWLGCGEPLDDLGIDIEDDAWFAWMEDEGHLIPDGIRRVAQGDENDRCHPVWYWVDDHDRTKHWRGSRKGDFRSHPYSLHRDHEEDRNDWDLLGDTLVRLTWQEVFDRFTLYDFGEFLWKRPRDAGWLSGNEWTILESPRRDTRDRGESIERLLNLCKVAKARGIQIYTVGFEMDRIGNYGRRKLARELLAGCATAPSYVFDVETVEINEAFRAIASQINQLRLIE